MNLTGRFSRLVPWLVLALMCGGCPAEHLSITDMDVTPRTLTYCPHAETSYPLYPLYPLYVGYITIEVEARLTDEVNVRFYDVKGPVAFQSSFNTQLGNPLPVDEFGLYLPGSRVSVFLTEEPSPDHA